MKRICVFCGSSPGARPEYRTAAIALGTALAERGIELVYGGAHLGLMGAVADAARAAGGHVIGVIPQALADRGVGHPELEDLRIVASMHERKATMAQLSDGFIALPGGLGTLEEVLEALTWAQLGMHGKPVGLLNVAGYYDLLTAFLDHAAEERFIHTQHRAMLLPAGEVPDLLEAMTRFVPPSVAKWLDRK